MSLPIGGGIGLATSSGGASTPVGYFGGVLDAALGSAWSEYRPQLEAQLAQFLGTGDLIEPGFTLYDIHVSISRDLAYSIDRDDHGDVVVSVTTGLNTITAHSTQPTVAGKWADPAVSVSFGLSFSYVLDIPPITAPLSATGFSHARILTPRIAPANLIADIAFFLNDVLDWITGVDLVDRLQQLVAEADFASVINGTLAPLNAELTRLAQEGYWFLDVIVDQLDGHSGSVHTQSLPGFANAPADRLEVLLTVRGYERTGVIEGEVSWPASLGAPGLPITQQLADLSRLSSVTLLSPPAATSLAVPAVAATVTADMTPAAQASVARVTTVIGQAAPTGPIDAALLRLDPDERAVAVDEVRRASASRLVALIGAGPVASLLDRFAGRASDLAIDVTTWVSNGPNTFPTARSVGRLGGLWASDDGTTCRRRYRLVDVAIDAPLNVTVQLAAGQVWRGSVTEVAAEPWGWDGTVTVHKAKPKPAHVFAKVADSAVLDARLKVADAVAVGGGIDEVALNPQPLPPKELGRPVSKEFGGLASKKLGGLRRTLGGADATDLAVDITGLKRAGDLVSHAKIDPDVFTHVLKRSNPTGDGLVIGIDFVLQEYHPPVIH
ncbi:hypothetical protein [Microbacterium sp.]|uniref:hypothetical protein n=1 Tax=Microbacterium sp. TaxID=51671 RepID=UPI003A90FA0F